MAYSTYTPTAAVFSDVDLPDDSELETSGIGATNTPMEAIADGLLYAAKLQAGTGIFATSSLGSAGSIADTIDAVTSTTVQYNPGGGAVDASYSLAGCITDDDLFIICTFGVASTPGAQIRTRITYASGATAVVVCTQYVPASGAYVNLTLQGSHTMLSDATPVVTVEVVNLAGTDTHIYGPIVWSAIRRRPTA